MFDASNPKTQPRYPKLMPSLDIGTKQAGLLALAAAGRGSTSDLVLGLLVSMGDQAVEEATWLAAPETTFFRLLNLAVHAAGGLFVDIVVLVKVGCIWVSTGLPSMQK